MANDVTSNPHTLDTVTTTPVWKGNIYVEHFEMIDYTADTDTVQLKNGAGKVIWEGNGADDLRPVRSGKIGWVIGGYYLAASNNAATRVRTYIK